MTSTEVPRPPRAAGLLLGGILTGVLLTVGSLGLWSYLAGPKHELTESQEQVYRQEVTEIDIGLNYSSVVLVSGDPGTVTVRRQLTWTRAKPAPVEQVVDGTLQIGSRCPYVFLGRAEQCRVDLVVEVPPDVAVRVSLYAGQIRAEELTGTTHLSTHNGSVTVADIRGRLWIRSEFGDISGTALRGGETDVKTTWGDVDLRFDAVPDLVQAVVGFGDVSVAVPPAGTGVDGYQIRASADSGRREVDVLQDSAARHTIVAHTDEGDVNVRHTTGD